MAEVTLEQLFSHYHNKVYHLALSLSRNQKDAEDILQLSLSSEGRLHQEAA